jgi:hypothetical protein
MSPKRIPDFDDSKIAPVQSQPDSGQPIPVADDGRALRPLTTKVYIEV